MSTEIVSFQTQDGVVGDGFVLKPDDVLESHKGCFQSVLVIGFDQEGDFLMAGSHGSREAMWMLVRGQNFLLNETE